MEENTIHEENVNVEETATKSKKDLTNVVGAVSIGLGAVGLFEGGKWLAKKAKKGIVKLAGKIETERANEETSSSEQESAGNDSEK